MRKKSLPLLLALFLAATSVVKAQQVNWQPPFLVREGFSQNIPYVGMVAFDQQGPYILYRPDLLPQYPWYMQVFIRAHEYGHVNTLHLPGDREANADAWAASQLAQSDPQVVDMIIWFLENQTREYARAQVVRRASGR